MRTRQIRPHPFPRKLHRLADTAPRVGQPASRCRQGIGLRRALLMPQYKGGCPSNRMAYHATCSSRINAQGCAQARATNNGAPVETLRMSRLGGRCEASSRVLWWTLGRPEMRLLVLKYGHRNIFLIPTLIYPIFVRTQIPRDRGHHKSSI